MGKQAPIDFSITSISDASRAYLQTGEFFMTSEFGILYNMSRIIYNLLTNRSTELSETFHFSLNQPYRLKEGRIILLNKGEVTLQYNLMEYVIHPPQIAFVPIDAIIQVTNITPDTELRMIGFGPNFIPYGRKDENVDYYWGNRQNLIVPLNERDLQLTEGYFNLIWNTVQAEEFHRDIVQHLLIALLHHINYVRKGYQKTIDHRLTHQDYIFNRFISLVDKYSISERTVSFYADKLCLTPRYLNTVIRQVSGQTVMEWINQAIILEAKVLLKHNDLLVYQIADKLNFSNPSFFCKFFKRITGMTPQEYQNS